MKYIKTYEASRKLSRNYIKVDEILCVDVSKWCKVFTLGKKYDIYQHNRIPNVYQILNDLGNATSIWSTEKYYNGQMENEFTTETETATFSFDETIEDYIIRKDASKYNL
jgi:hypothetical protein